MPIDAHIVDFANRSAWEHKKENNKKGYRSSDSTVDL